MAEHPITPPPELVQQWLKSDNSFSEDLVAAAQWGADQELEACCTELRRMDWNVEADHIVARRRPKPPSLKQQALDAFERFTSGDNGIADDMRDGGIIRRALEALPDEELGQ